MLFGVISDQAFLSVCCADVSRHLCFLYLCLPLLFVDFACSDALCAFDPLHVQMLGILLLILACSDARCFVGPCMFRCLVCC